MKNYLVKLIAGIALLFSITMGFNPVNAQHLHPNIYSKDSDRSVVLSKIKTESWAKAAYQKLLASIDPYVTQHQKDPKWITSRLAMYWKDGEHYTQCYLKDQLWDYGTGNAPFPTVRMPGMRVWNEYSNVPLSERTPYNQTGDMKGVSKANPKAGIVVVPYKKSGHLIRGNNNEILTLAEKSAFVFWLTGEAKYAKFSADIYNTWVLGTYYMNPILDPDKSSGGPGGYAPGGILGYYDYEQIHDDLSTHAAVIYDFMKDYLEKNTTKDIEATGKKPSEVSATVLKRFIDIGMVRGGKKGNWNVNGWEMIMPAILALEPDSYYPDHHGKEYYLNYYTTKSTDYHDALPDILAFYDKTTGLWPESPGYASGTITSLLNMALPIYKSGVNTINNNPMMQKAALSIFPWLDARGNLVNFGDGRGGPGDFTRFEHLLTYYDWMGDKKNASLVSSALQKGIDAKQYDRADADWKGICLNVAKLPVSGAEISYARAAYSPVHRHIIMKNGNDEDNALMFTLYGGYPKQKHLSPNGLAMQLYGKGWALGPDASGYESYWSADYRYHQTATGSNTILPGYTDGPITVNAMEPALDSLTYATSEAMSAYCSFVDVSAGEKRRIVAMVRTSKTSGYYIDMFRSAQKNNDYLYHNLGNTLTVKDNQGKGLPFKSASALDTVYSPGYSYFKNPRSAGTDNSFTASWTINSSTPAIAMDMWMKGSTGREVFMIDAPYTNLNASVSPGKVNIAPDPTSAVIVRQNNVNGWESPFVSVFEPYSPGSKSIRQITDIGQTSVTALEIENISSIGSKQYVLSSLDDEFHSLKDQISFSGTFAVVSHNSVGMQYMYLGNGKLIQDGKFKIESSSGRTAACLTVEGRNIKYSAAKPVIITFAYDRPVKAYMVEYTIDGKTEKQKVDFNATDRTIKVSLPAGLDVTLNIK